MSLLDDLKSQAEQQQNANSRNELELDASGCEFYREHVRLRMDAAYNFLKELVNQLNTLKLVTRVNYPFKPEGKKVTLQHEEYRVFPDSVPDIRQISLTFTCSLVNPAAFEIRGHGPVLAHSELLDRFQFEYEKLEQKDSRQFVTSAKFRLLGPLKIKFVLQYDDSKQIIKLLLTNFVGPGTSQYNLKPEQIDEAFLDHLGKYILRKEANLFKEEISDDVKAMLRKKLQEEQMQRENEIKEAEELQKAEEAARRENSTTGQLKKAVSHSVTENSEKLKKVMQEQVNDKKEKLKSMFNRLKEQAGFDSAPEQRTGQTSAPPVAPTASARVKPEPPAQQAVDPIQINATQATSAEQNATAQPKPPVEQKKTTPPKVFQASASNPFLKPADFQPVPEGGDEQAEQADTTKPDASAAMTSNPFLPPKVRAVPETAQAKPAGQSGSNAAAATKSPNPFLPQKAPPAPETAQAKPVGDSQSNAVAATKSPNPFLPQKAPPAPETGQAKPAGQPESNAAATTGIPKPFLSPKAPAAPAGSGLSLEPIASDSESSSSKPAMLKTPDPNMSPDAGQAKSVVEPDASAAMTSNPTMQPKVPPAAQAGSGLSLEPIASDSESLSLAAMTEPESEPSSDVSSLSLEDELERDLARFMENDQQEQPVESKTADDLSSTSGKPDFDLSTPDALEINFEDRDEA